MNDKAFKKFNIKFEIKIQQCTPVSSFSQFGERQFLESNQFKRHFKVEYQGKRNLGITYFKQTIL